ncbi:MAG: SDR family NAD(P)-dependent oxidoreductase [Alphaproteobacteria bacterium]|nr:SDR family NAD(P)-dependent oxidoreductase [Alphaproteobacteria bacterium]
MKIKGHVAIVTGGASGLGAAVAKVLAREGAKLAIFDRNIDAAREMAESLQGDAFACDVSQGDSAIAAFAQAKDKLGVARIIVNCAGILLPKRILSRDGVADLAHFERTVSINLTGTFNILRLAAETMQDIPPLPDTGERGVIINTASIAAYDGQIGQAAYAASKGGVVSLTLPAARELAEFGIRVMAIAPGAAETPMIESLADDVRQSLYARIPFPSRFVKPEEFAELARHIIENPMLNGEVIRLDGAARLEPK